MVKTVATRLSLYIGCIGATVKLALILWFRFSGRGTLLRIILADYLPTQFADAIAKLTFNGRRTLPSLGEAGSYELLLVLGSFVEWFIIGFLCLSAWKLLRNLATSRDRPRAS